MAVEKLDLTSLELINKEGEAIVLNTSLYKYIGLFISKHCYPCEEFTPRLIKYYEAKKDTEKFEIVFVSFDTNEKAFIEHFATMPWVALKYGEEDAKTALSKRYGKPGFPTLIILKSDGSFVSTDGRKAVDKDSPFWSLEA